MNRAARGLPWLAVFALAAYLAFRASAPAPLVSAAPVADERPARLPPAPAPVAEATAAVEATLAPDPGFGAGFCTKDGDEGPILIRHTLRGFLQDTANDPAVDAELRKLARAGLEVSSATASDVLRRAQAMQLERGDGAVVAAARAAAAHELERVELEREALRAAFAFSPEAPGIAWATADAFRHSPDIGLAVRALATYLRHAGDVPALARLKARLEVERDIEHGYRVVTRDGISLLHPPDALSAADAERLLSAVAADLDEASRLVGVRRRPSLTVVVSPGREEILAVTCVRSWAAALYDGTLRLVHDADAPGGFDRTVLRHETLHAALSPAAPKAPLWFDEGVAQAFAHEQAQVRHRWELMVRSRSYIPFASMDGTFQVFDAHEDAALAYAQSLAMVEFLVERGGADAVARATAMFRDGADTTAVLSAVTATRAVSGDDLLAFLARRLASGP